MKKLTLPILISFGLYSSIFGQGSITPPAAPAPTMKTLTQIEPRTDLLAAPIPAGVTTDANYQFIINQPGSYYLSSNLAVTKPNGIKINAQAVTIDLNGFEISGTGAGNGIEISSTSHRANIRNGSIRTFAYGINSLSSASGYARNCAFRDLVVFSCTGGGLVTGDSALVESCRAHDNTGTYTILAHSGSTLMNCTASNNVVADTAIYGAAACSLINCAAYGNNALYGIQGSNSLLKDCVASQNTHNNGQSAGIFASECAVVNCVSSHNSTAGVASSSSGAGLILDKCHIEGCIASGNAGSGFNINFSNSITNCKASDNGFPGTGDGVTTTGKNNRIDSNLCTDNAGYGIRSSGPTADFIMRNTCYSNHGTVSGTSTADYSPSSGSYFGPLSLPGSATSPWANF